MGAIQSSVNQMLGVAGIIGGLGNIDKSIKENKSIVEKYAEALSNKEMKVPESVGKGIEKEGVDNIIKKGIPKKQGDLKESEVTKNNDPDVIAKYKQMLQEKTNGNIYSPADTKVLGEIERHDTQKTRMEEHFKNTREGLYRKRLEYYASANVTDDRGLYTNRKTRKDIQQFLERVDKGEING